MFSILSRRCPLLATSLSVLFCLLSMLISDSRFDLVWFRLSCDHGWIRSGSVNVRKKKKKKEEKTLFESNGAEQQSNGEIAVLKQKPHTMDTNLVVR